MSCQIVPWADATRKRRQTGLVAFEGRARQLGRPTGTSHATALFRRCPDRDRDRGVIGRKVGDVVVLERGSPYRATIPAPAESFVLRSGAPKIYIKTADSGTKRVHAFCPECGTPIYACAVRDPPTYSLRTGAIRQRAALRPRRQIWCRSALPWSVDLGAIEKIDQQ